LIDTPAVWNVFRLKPGSPALDQIGVQFAGKPLMIFEAELLNFKLDQVDANIFLAPPEYRQVDLLDLLREQNIRRNGLTPQ
jgi:hypothetical protein